MEEKAQQLLKLGSFSFSDVCASREDFLKKILYFFI